MRGAERGSFRTGCAQSCRSSCRLFLPPGGLSSHFGPNTSKRIMFPSAQFPFQRFPYHANNFLASGLKNLGVVISLPCSFMPYNHEPDRALSSALLPFTRLPKGLFALQLGSVKRPRSPSPPGRCRGLPLAYLIPFFLHPRFQWP